MTPRLSPPSPETRDSSSHLSLQMASALPIDIWHIIFEFLEPPDLLSLALTTKLFATVILPSTLFQTWKSLCPSSRKPLAMSWFHTRWITKTRSKGYNVLDAPIYRTPDAADTEEEMFDPENPFPVPRVSFPQVITETPGCEVIDFVGQSSTFRDGTVVYLSEMELRRGIAFTPRVVNTWRVDIRDIGNIEMGIQTTLPPDRHVVRPSGEHIVGDTLMWVDDVQSPLYYSISETGINFRVSPEGGYVPSPFEFSYMTVGDEPIHSPFSDLIVRWLAMMSPSNQMFSAVPSLRGRQQRLHLFDVYKKTSQVIDVRSLLGDGIWSAPWILPLGSDNQGNLVVKILDSDRTTPARRARTIQRSFNISTGKIRWTVELVDAVTLTPWDSHLYNDHCFGYVYSRNDQLFANIYHLDTGEQISTVGPFPVPLTPVMRRWQCNLTSFFVLFQDQTRSLEPNTIPKANPTPCYFYSIRTGEFLYRLDPPATSLSFEAPRAWMFRGEDPSERYLLFNGLGQQSDNAWPERLCGSKKWLILDTVGREWLYATSIVERRWMFTRQGVHVLYREKDGGEGVQGLRFEYARMDIPVQ